MVVDLIVTTCSSTGLLIVVDLIVDGPFVYRTFDRG